MSKINANSIRVGNVLQHNGRLCVVTKTMHTKPGKGGAFMQVEMKCLREGTKFNERFRSAESVERAHLEEKEFQFLFLEDNKMVLMDPESYEQIHIDKDIIGDLDVYLQDGMMVTVMSHEAKPVSAQIPEQVILSIVECEPVVKGQTAASSGKPAVLENGVRVIVPTFVDVGDRVVVRTEDSTYIERAK